MNSLVGLIACAITGSIVAPTTTFAACYLNTDANSACTAGAARTSLGWTPNAAARETLLKSTVVQNSLTGCENMGKLLKSECQPVGPVLSIYFSASGSIEVESAAIEIDGLMHNDITLPNEFRVYFQQAAVAANLGKPDTPIAPVVPEKPQMKIPTPPPRSKALSINAADANDGILDTIIKMITPTPPKTCSFGGNTYSVGSGVMAFEAASGSICRSAMRSCQADGTLSASTYNYPSCVTIAPPPAAVSAPAPAPVPLPAPVPAPVAAKAPSPVQKSPKAGKFMDYEF